MAAPESRVKVFYIFLTHSCLLFDHKLYRTKVSSDDDFQTIHDSILADEGHEFLEEFSDLQLLKPSEEIFNAIRTRDLSFPFHQHMHELVALPRTSNVCDLYTPGEEIIIVIRLPFIEPKPEELFITVAQRGQQRQRKDVSLNGIRKIDYSEVDSRVLELCDTLRKARKIPKTVYDRIKDETEKFSINDLLKSATALPTRVKTHGQTLESWRREAEVYYNLSCFSSRARLYNDASNSAKESVIDSQFFVPFCESLRARNVADNRSFTCLFSNRQWPFDYQLICKVQGAGDLLSYKPCSNNSVWMGQIPLFISETYSQGGSNVWRLQIQAALLVKLLNANEKGIFFALPAIYFERDYTVTVRYFYCLDTSVFYHQTKYKLYDTHDALAFAVLLFNIADQDLFSLLPHSLIAPTILADIETYGTLTSRAPVGDVPEPQEDDSHPGPGGSQGGSGGGKTSQAAPTNHSRTRSQSKAASQKRSAPLAHLPPAKRVKLSLPPILLPPALTAAGYRPGRVIRSSNHSSLMIVRKGTIPCIIKKVKQQSPEAVFFTMCQDLHLVNIIQPELIVSVAQWCFIALPFYSVLAKVFLPGGKLTAVRPHLLSMTYDLAEALTALHDHGIAHRDIKPENLVYNEHFRLLLIDFDQTVSVTSENQNVSDQSGTRYWSAPEVTKGIPYSPIRADRYSCGLVFDSISKFAILEPAIATQLTQFSRRLRAADPEVRPPLAEWQRSPTSDTQACN